MTGLDEALGPRLLLALVAVQAERNDALHLVLPLLLDDVEEALGADVVVRCSIVCLSAVRLVGGTVDVLFTAAQIGRG